MISRIFRTPFIPTRLISRSGGFERPDPPIMVPYENRRTLGLISKFLYRNDGVAPAYAINDYSLEDTMMQRIYNLFKNLIRTVIIISPLLLIGWIYGTRVPQTISVTSVDLEKMNKLMIDSGQYRKIQKQNPYGLEVEVKNLTRLIPQQNQRQLNKRHQVVRNQGTSYINRLKDEVVRDIHNGTSASSHH